MKYKNAKNVLPEELLQQIQQYIQGDVIYIPIAEIVNIYNLSESSIRKIISKIKKENNKINNDSNLGGVTNE